MDNVQAYHLAHFKLIFNFLGVGLVVHKGVQFKVGFNLTFVKKYISHFFRSMVRNIGLYIVSVYLHFKNAKKSETSLVTYGRLIPLQICNT